MNRSFYFYTLYNHLIETMDRIIRFSRVIFIFYRSFRVPASIITVLCCIGLFQACIEQIREHQPFHGILMFVAPFFWIKTLTNALILGYLISFRTDELYLYYNFGVGKKSLWSITFLMDYLLFFLVIYCTELALKLYMK